MTSRNTVLRAVNQLSLGTWFGGSLMGAVAMPSAAALSDRPLEAEGQGWKAWQPVQAAAIVAQLVSGAGLTYVNRGRVLGQYGVARTSAARTVLTGAALLATVVAARGGRTAEQVAEDGDGGGSEADLGQAALSVTRVAQWSVPLLTGAMLVLDARMGEQQRPTQVLLGVLKRSAPPSVGARLRSA